MLERDKDSEWVAPYFAQTKPKSNMVRFLSDFSNLNKKLKRKPYSMSKINWILLKLEGFQYATSLYLNMGYYCIRLRKNANNLCTTILPWGKYCYKCLQMEISNSPDIFQQKMNDLFHGFDFICAYIDDLLILIKKLYWTDHVQNICN